MLTNNYIIKGFWSNTQGTGLSIYSNLVLGTEYKFKPLRPIAGGGASHGRITCSPLCLGMFIQTAPGTTPQVLRTLYLGHKIASTNSPLPAGVVILRMDARDLTHTEGD